MESLTSSWKQVSLVTVAVGTGIGVGGRGSDCEPLSIALVCCASGGLGGAGFTNTQPSS